MSARTSSEEPAGQGAPAGGRQAGWLQDVLTGNLYGVGRQFLKMPNIYSLVDFITFMVHCDKE